MKVAKCSHLYDVRLRDEETKQAEVEGRMGSTGDVPAEEDCRGGGQKEND